MVYGKMESRAHIGQIRRTLVTRIEQEGSGSGMTKEGVCVGCKKHADR